MKNDSQIKFAFFGSSNFSVFVLDELKINGFIPNYIVTTPDKKQGRKMTLTANVVKKWAENNNIEVFSPIKLDTVFIESIHDLQNTDIKCDVFVVASYGKIIPEALINIPPRKTLNIHPSLLPKYRGPSPLPSVIIANDKNTGVTIMQMDKEMDHGAIVAKKSITIDNWPTYEIFENKMAVEGARLLIEILPKWVKNEIPVSEQNHEEATFTKKIVKEDGLLDMTDDQYVNFRKIQAYHEWPQAFYFIDHANKVTRVKITSALFEDGKLIIKKVIPEGAREMDYEDFKRGYLVSKLDDELL